MTAPEIWFYHLESQPLHAVLPVLVEKTLNRGWRAILRFSTQERLETIDSALWTYREESFLPHGTARDGHAERQPVFLTTDGKNPTARMRCSLSGDGERAYSSRASSVFDGADGEARALARQEWKDAKAAGLPVSYWKQDANGAWKKSA
jgi:DNA polymerase-3 subunit chi